MAMEFSAASIDKLPTLDLARLATWLVDTGLAGGRMEELVGGLCDRFNASGLRIARAYVAMSTLHPLVRAYGYTWDRNQPVVQVNEFEHVDAQSQAWTDSPFNYMLSNNVDRLRRYLVGPQAKLDFPVLAEFRDMGLDRKSTRLNSSH